MAREQLASRRGSIHSSASISSVVSFVVESGGERLDKVVPQQIPALSRAMVQRLIKDGAVTVNHQLSKASCRPRGGDEITVHVPVEIPETTAPEDIPLDIIHDEQRLLLVNKPAGMVVHPALGHTTGTLVNALMFRFPEIAEVGGAERAGLVHRLDMGTSGLLIVAKDEATHAALQRQFKRRRVHKTYVALVEGQIFPRDGAIEAPVGRDRRRRKRMAVVKTGRDARTEYRGIEHFHNYTLLEVYPRTGRTHQIRVHLSWLGYPVVGDAVYGRRRQRLLPERLFLHAARIRFTHPVAGQEMEFEAPLPPELKTVLKKLRRH